MRTACDSSGESVYAVRDQSADAPIALSWARIAPPVSATKSSVRFTNICRPRSKRVDPSSAISRSTTFCVAIPAWSVPGTHRASVPRIRAQRMTTSWIVLFRPCPTCRIAVTFGGGMTIVNGVRSPPARFDREASAVKAFALNQRW